MMIGMASALSVLLHVFNKAAAAAETAPVAAAVDYSCLHDAR